MLRRVLLVLALADGGMGHHVLAVERDLLRRGLDVQVACPSATQEVFGFQRHVCIDVGTNRQLTDSLRAVRALRARPADVVHAHGLRAGALSAVAAPQNLVVSWHNAQLEKTLLGGALERFVARRATVSLAASPDLAEHARGLGAREVQFFPVPAPRRVPRGTDLGLGHPLVLSVGRLAPQKGYETLIAALPAFPEAVVAVAGEGPLRERFEQLAPRVHWLGRRDDVADLYAAADVVVLPSLWEARSLTAQEALRAGRPLVATAVGGLPGLLQDGALFVPAADPEALGSAVRTLLDDPVAARRLADRGQRVAEGWPDEDEVSRRLEKVYTDVAARGGRG